MLGKHHNILETLGGDPTPLPATLRPQMTFIAINRTNKTLETRRSGRSAQRGELRIDFWWDPDAHLGVITHSLPVHPTYLVDDRLSARLAFS